jgi:small conductance mechanosensitive channel
MLDGIDLLRVGEDVLQGLVFLVALWVVARVLRRVVRRGLAGKKVRADVALLTERVLYVGLIGLGLFMFVALAIGQAGTALAGVLLAAFITSLGLQDLFKNYVAGFYVLMERNVLPGREIRTGAYTGVVEEVRLRTTYLRTESGETIVVPNSNLFNDTVAVAPDEDQPESVERSQDHPGKGVEAGPGEV